MTSGLAALLIASCGRFGYDPLLLEAEGGDANGGAPSGGSTDSPSGGTAGSDTGGGGGSAPANGGAGGSLSVDSGITTPPDSGAAGAPDAAPDPTCFDSIQNQDETGVDCGGSVCPACATCSDNIQNQGETAIDCGGSNCAPCPCSFGTPQLLGNPNNPGHLVFAPTLSSDGLTLYISAIVPGFAEQVGVTTRPSRGNNFNFANSVPSPVDTFIEGTPELSADGLSLYFYSQRAGGAGDRDLYVATRASTGSQFNSVSRLTSINSSARDDRPWVSPDELTIYFSSQRASATDDLWRATRGSRAAAFGTPVPVTELNSNDNDAGIYLTADGLVAFFASDRSGGSGGVDIYRASRANTSSPFTAPQLVPGLNTSADDFDPQLTADGQEMFFASNRNSSDYRLYRSLVTCP